MSIKKHNPLGGTPSECCTVFIISIIIGVVNFNLKIIKRRMQKKWIQKSERFSLMTPPPPWVWWVRTLSARTRHKITVQLVIANHPDVTQLRQHPFPSGGKPSKCIQSHLHKQTLTCTKWQHAHRTTENNHSVVDGIIPNGAAKQTEKWDSVTWCYVHKMSAENG